MELPFVSHCRISIFSASWLSSLYHDRFRRYSGGIDGPEDSLPDASTQYRATSLRKRAVRIGWLDTDPYTILKALRLVLDGPLQLGSLPPLWDGQAAMRIGDVLDGWLERKPEKETSRPTRPADAAAL